MHDFCGTDNRVDWAGVNAERAADAKLFINHGDFQGLVCAAVGIQRNLGALQERG